MQVLTALDATFIYLESEHSPMAIGALYVIDAKDAPEGFSYASWHKLVASRLRGSKVFRERLVEVPWAMSFPYWIRDPNFNLKSHLPRKTLAKPGGMTELMQLAAENWSEVLDRSRPLWEMVFVEGLDTVEGISKGSFALITKVHHAAVDGKAGGEMMSSLMDLSPEIRQLKGKDNWEPEEIPSSWEVITEAWSGAARKAMALPGFIGKTVAGAAHVYTDKRLRQLNAPPRILSAPKTIFNQQLSSAKTFWGRDFDFRRIKAIRKAVPGTTINDVVLAICAGGLRHYLLEKNQLPEKQLVTMAPISVRKDTPGDDSGNQVSAMLVGLETNVSNPLKRLLNIHANTSRSKIHASAMPASELTDFLPSETLAAAARVYTRTRLGGRHRPFFNVTITNVPGPPVPFYLAGAKINSVYGMAPILDGLGLLLVVLSYQDQISIGINSCEQIIPDPKFLADCLGQSLDELEAAALQLDSPAENMNSQANELEPRVDSNPLAAARLALDQAFEAINNLQSKEPENKNES
ncbi:MAG: wax ester/triacylglycerol synthase family O-acyltransferase [Xanthomonadales bacterium]|nr:wax ester/triacylglycerol synthase family O-acyltransferase [Xanthomonadales bacterium]